jgi:hypothetical protein
MRQAWSAPGGQHRRRTTWQPVSHVVPYRPRARAVGRQRRLRNLLIGLLWLALLASHAPQMWSFLVSDLPQVASAALHDAATWANHTAARIPDRIQVLANPHEQHVYWQVGLTTGDADIHATGMRARIVTRLPQQVNPDTTNYYWVGSYLSDSSFIQVGYYVPARDVKHAGWFYCAFYADGREGPCIYGSMGSAGGDGAVHTYTLEAAQSGMIWRALMDDRPLGTFRWTVGESGANTPVIYAESSGYQPHASISILGPVDFPDGVAVRHQRGDGYTRALHLWVVYSAPNVCPPYGVALDGHGGVLLGSGLACPDRWSQLT